jgi:predicted DCC family thiol-disulfide oxidoreductase YuxK
VRHLVLYDGVCGLCNGLNAFLLPRDSRGDFAFASLQSPTAKALLARFGRTTEHLDTFYVIKDFESASPALLAKSQAGLFALTSLGGVWRLAGGLNVLPTPLLDVGYDWMARNRYRIFGKYETCPMPAPEHRRRFIDI